MGLPQLQHNEQDRNSKGIAEYPTTEKQIQRLMGFMHQRCEAGTGHFTKQGLQDNLRSSKVLISLSVSSSCLVC